MSAAQRSLGWTAARMGRLIPTNSGLSRIGGSRFAKSLANEDDPRTCRLRCGLQARVRTDSLIGRTLYLCGDYDPKVSKLCSIPLRPGDVMVDIGAQFGDTALPATKRVGPAGMIHAFEPNPRSAALLRESIELNGLKNITVHQVALSDTDEERDLFIPEGSPEAGTLTNRGASREGSRVRVVTRRASDYLKEIGVGPIRVLKLDVEGHEGVVLRGLSDFMRDHPPAVVIFESERRRGPFHEREEVAVLNEHGYRIYQVQKGIWRIRLSPVPDDFPSQGASYDFVAVHPKADQDLRNRLGADG